MPNSCCKFQSLFEVFLYNSVSHWIISQTRYVKITWKYKYATLQKLRPVKPVRDVKIRLNDQRSCVNLNRWRFIYKRHCTDNNPTTDPTPQPPHHPSNYTLLNGPFVTLLSRCWCSWQSLLPILLILNDWLIFPLKCLALGHIHAESSCFTFPTDFPNAVGFGPAPWSL